MALQRFLNMTGTLGSRSGYDKYGKEQTLTGVSVSCRFQETTKTRMLPDGSVEPVDAYAFFDPSVAISPGDHFTVGSVNYRVLNVNQVVDGNGKAHHNEVNLSKWQT